MKEVWYNYLINHSEYWGHGVTLKRLEKVKQHVFSDKPTMDDLLIRHKASEMTPEQMKEYSSDLFDHCMGNFAANVYYIMMDLKMIKP